MLQEYNPRIQFIQNTSGGEHGITNLSALGLISWFYHTSDTRWLCLQCCWTTSME